MQPPGAECQESVAERAETEYNVGVSATRKLTVSCPECQADLVIDAATGEILSHRPAKREPAGGKDLDTLFADMDREKAHAEDVFEREKAALKDHDRLLEEKFNEALRRAEEEPDDDEPPVRPWDLD